MSLPIGQCTGGSTWAGNGQPTLTPPSSAIYLRTVSISRQSQLATGNVGYRSSNASLEVVLFSGLSANIMFQTRGPNPLADVPAGTVGRTIWFGFVPAASVPAGSVRHNDVLSDDLGRRFKMNEPEWGAIDVRIELELLRA